MKVLFAHGFEGVPNGRKARYLRDVARLDIVAPLMNGKGWSFEDRVAVVEKTLADNPDIELLVGSRLTGCGVRAPSHRRVARGGHPGAARAVISRASAYRRRLSGAWTESSR